MGPLDSQPPTPNTKPPTPSTRPLKESFHYAFRGLGHALRTQRNLRIHLLAALLVVAAGFGLGVPPLEGALLALAITLVLVAELTNSALESLADATHPGYHPLVGVAKDLAASAVLVSAGGAVVVGLLVLGPRLLGGL